VVRSYDGAPRKALHAVYDALSVATDLFALLNRYPDGFPTASAKEIVVEYTDRLFRFDQLYRWFCEAADSAESRDWDILKTLRQRIEEAYGNGYLARLALAWDKPLSGGLLDNWTIEGGRNQQQFFDTEVKPVLAQSDDRRVFVVISDAFRYEAAAELTGLLNGRYRFEAELVPQLGVLPSCTSLGMAALLPHDALAYVENGTLQVDGLPCASLEQRRKILEPANGIAIKAEAFMGMKKEVGRTFVKPYRVVYIYHNKIDAIGDSASPRTTPSRRYVPPSMNSVTWWARSLTASTATWCWSRPTTASCSRRRRRRWWRRMRSRQSQPGL
jgi:uncharacterized protein (TIGR02687 family)